MVVKWKNAVNCRDAGAMASNIEVKMIWECYF